MSPVQTPCPGGYVEEKSKASSAFEIVCRDWWKYENHSERQYKFLIQGVVDLLRISQTMDERFDPTRDFNA
jgi:hypothetical protein